MLQPFRHSSSNELYNIGHHRLIFTWVVYAVIPLTFIKDIIAYMIMYVWNLMPIHVGSIQESRTRLIVINITSCGWNVVITKKKPMYTGVKSDMLYSKAHCLPLDT